MAVEVLQVQATTGCQRGLHPQSAHRRVTPGQRSQLQARAAAEIGTAAGGHDEATAKVDQLGRRGKAGPFESQVEARRCRPIDGGRHPAARPSASVTSRSASSTRPDLAARRAEAMPRSAMSPTSHVGAGPCSVLTRSLPSTPAAGCELAVELQDGRRRAWPRLQAQGEAHRRVGGERFRRQAQA